MPCYSETQINSALMAGAVCSVLVFIAVAVCVGLWALGKIDR